MSILTAILFLGTANWLLLGLSIVVGIAAFWANWTMRRYVYHRFGVELAQYRAQCKAGGMSDLEIDWRLLQHPPILDVSAIPHSLVVKDELCAVGVYIFLIAAVIYCYNVGWQWPFK